MMLSACPDMPGYAYRLSHDLPSDAPAYDVLWLTLCIEATRERWALLPPASVMGLVDALGRLSRYDWYKQARELAASADAQLVCRDVRCIYVSEQFMMDNGELAAVEVHYCAPSGPDHVVTWWRPSILSPYNRQVLYQAFLQSTTASAMSELYLLHLSQTGSA